MSCHLKSCIQIIFLDNADAVGPTATFEKSQFRKMMCFLLPPLRSEICLHCSQNLPTFWCHPWIGEHNGNDSVCSQIYSCNIEIVCKRANCPSMQWVGDTPVSSATLKRVGTCRSSIENPLAHEKHANILTKHRQTSCILK